ncbi:MAG: 2Fe-2S iron-sulfur cluster-binding protein [Acidobacteriota bacterium]
MTHNSGSLFAAYLNSHNEEKWREVIESLLPAIHVVDKAATQIWFYFYPLSLHQALEQAQDCEALAKRLLLKGKYSLKEQIDSSHTFLYGHRYWSQVKSAVAQFATSNTAPKSLELAAQIKDVALEVGKQIGVDASLLVGITAVAFMTLQQVGIAAFKAAPGTLHISKKAAHKTPEQVLANRAKDEGQGLLGFLRGYRKIFKVTFDENDDEAHFPIINTQQITTAAAEDKRDYYPKDSRCVTGEGAIPIECRSGACGTCWVGILGGIENTSDIAGLEYRKMPDFGYILSEEDKPLIRLACQTQVTGPVSIVIPPWSGVFGKFIRALKDEDNEQSNVSY